MADHGPDRVVGVYHHPDGRAKPWEARWVLGGRMRCRSFASEDKAIEVAAERALQIQGRAQLPGAEAQDTTARDGRGSWLSALEQMRDIIVDPATEPADREDAKDCLRYLAQGANAAAKFVDIESVLRRLDKLERATVAERKGRQHGSPVARVAAPAARARAGAGAGSAKRR